MKKLLFITLMLTFGLTGFSQTITWDGSTSDDWNEGANWDGNTVPTATDDVVIPHVNADFPDVLTGETADAKSITITGTEPIDIIELFVHGTLTVVEDITVSNAASVLKIWSGGKVIYNGDIVNNGSIVVDGELVTP